MRTTLTLDEDVAKMVQMEVRRSGEPMKQTINRLLRSGLLHGQSAPSPKPFRVNSKKLGIPREWTSGSIEDLLEILDGPGHR